MADTAPAATRYTTARFFGLVDQGVLRPDDRVELLEGAVVAMSPQNPRHASVTSQIDRVLRDAIGSRAAIRVQLPLVAGPYSVPEPDVAVVSGQEGDYCEAHPTTALLVIEVADTSLLQDRLTKSTIYASAGIPEYWIVNLVDECVEVFRSPNRQSKRYADGRIVRHGERLDLVGVEGGSVLVDLLLPRRTPGTERG